MDTQTSQQRHANMAAIHSKDTKPEMVVRRWLWGRGFRYRLNSPRLPGHPDLVLRKYRTCVFVNGCFWHGHGASVADGHVIADGAFPCFRMPGSNVEFWERKIRRNKRRDVEVQRRLAEMGWHCVTIWECELKPSVREQTLESLAYTLNKIWLDDHSLHGSEPKPYPRIEEESGLGMAAEPDVGL